MDNEHIEYDEPVNTPHREFANRHAHTTERRLTGEEMPPDAKLPDSGSNQDLFFDPGIVTHPVIPEGSVPSRPGFHMPNEEPPTDRPDRVII